MPLLGDLIEKAKEIEAQAGAAVADFTAPHASLDSSLNGRRQALEHELNTMPSPEWLRGSGRQAEANANAARRERITAELAKIEAERQSNTLAFYEGKARLVSAWKDKINDLLGEARRREDQALQAIKVERGQLNEVYNNLAGQEREAGNGATGVRFAAMDARTGLLRSY